MTSKIVRIRPSVRQVVSPLLQCLFIPQCLFDINTISRIDDEISDNEKETPLFKVEELPLKTCCCQDVYPSDQFPLSLPTRFQYFKEVNDNKQILYLSELKIGPTPKGCCSAGFQYFILPDIINYKSNNLNEQSVIKRHDSRNLYRIYEYLGQSQFKLGNPFVENEPSCLDYCCCCSYYCPFTTFCSSCYFKSKMQTFEHDFNNERRKYINIFNLDNQAVGKFALYYEKSCCTEKKQFYEVYFPPEANEMTRIALLSQCLFIFKFGSPNFQFYDNCCSHNPHFFSQLPSDSSGIERFYD